jgi:hypothetical protein
VYFPVTLSGMSICGSRATPTILYELTGFDGAVPGLTVCAAIGTLKSLSPMSWP